MTRFLSILQDISVEDPDGISAIQNRKDHGRMTQAAVTNNVANVVGYYDSNATVAGYTCPKCGMYIWNGMYHDCVTTSPFIYPQWNWETPKLDPFVEFKKLYRKLITEEFIRQAEDAIHGKYKDNIDKPTREDLLDYLEGIAMDIVRDEPSP